MFLVVLAVHAPAGLTCVVTGALAALSRKGSRRHIIAGRIYGAAIWVVFTTALLLTALRWPHDLHLAAIGAVSFTAALLGRAARRRHWPGDRAHILGMGISYVALLTAFYVDNGPKLPLWDRMPTITFWLAPPLIGAAIIRRALTRRHSVVQAAGRDASASRAVRSAGASDDPNVPVSGGDGR